MYTYVHYTETLGRIDVQDMFFVYTLCPQKTKADNFLHYHSLNGSSDSVNGDLQFLWG